MQLVHRCRRNLFNLLLAAALLPSTQLFYFAPTGLRVGAQDVAHPSSAAGRSPGGTVCVIDDDEGAFFTGPFVAFCLLTVVFHCACFFSSRSSRKNDRRHVV
eukprot:TRINITY_DN11528_c0_g1_i1.p1 TRINITY_DN11528_c0_g1~~TRINITY_DN11528_c0_g1_i1.p1  ORF type:complete len:102 (-),score=10.29 TRINITY_DN11528_c0_g1_i1:391-696(-)